ncbi:hypothetical protein ADL03_00035 [Nocardia sp. NRRL S-836]|nr:hypothetical protein ADL03_00035 [Nocardia sp. NRRL S-836]
MVDGQVVEPVRIERARQARGGGRYVLALSQQKDTGSAALILTEIAAIAERAELRSNGRTDLRTSSGLRSVQS